MKSNSKEVLGKWLNWRKGTDKQNIVVFVMVPNFCGSTLLCSILNSSNHVSFVNPEGTYEAQQLPGLSHLFPKEKRWDSTYAMDWGKIRIEFEKRWDKRKNVWIEKSPPNIKRVDDIMRTFPEARYISMVRNPYAFAESLMRRSGRTVESASKISMRRMGYQMRNDQILEKSRNLFFSYEQLVQDAKAIKEKLLNFIPELEEINVESSYSVHNLLGKREMGITNLNKVKIDRISDNDLAVMQDIFSDHMDILEYFGYSLDPKDA